MNYILELINFFYDYISPDVLQTQTSVLYGICRLFFYTHFNCNLSLTAERYRIISDMITIEYYGWNTPRIFYNLISFCLILATYMFGVAIQYGRELKR